MKKIIAIFLLLFTCIETIAFDFSKSSIKLMVFNKTDKQKDVLVTLSCEDKTMGNVYGAGTFKKDSEINISATANKGYRFVSWNDNNIDNPRIITLKYDTLFSAIFEPETYIIDVNTNDIMMGEVCGKGLYKFNTEAILTAKAFEGYDFIKWNDGNTDNPRTIKVNDREHIYIAIFAPKYNFEIKEKLTCYPNPTTGIVNLNKKAKLVEVINSSDLLVASFINKSVIDISELPAGNYTFKVTINEGIETLKVVLK